MFAMKNLVAPEGDVDRHCYKRKKQKSINAPWKFRRKIKI